MIITLQTKRPLERRVITLDFTSELDPTETLTQITSSSISVATGTDPAPASVLGAPQINPSAFSLQLSSIQPYPKSVNIDAAKCVQVAASGGVDGCSYLIQVTCATNNPNKILTREGILPVSSK